MLALSSPASIRPLQPGEMLVLGPTAGPVSSPRGSRAGARSGPNERIRCSPCRHGDRHGAGFGARCRPLAGPHVGGLPHRERRPDRSPLGLSELELEAVPRREDFTTRSAVRSQGRQSRREIFVAHPDWLRTEVREDGARHARLRQPAELRADRRVSDEHSARLPAHERGRQRRSIPDVEPRVRERLGRRVKGDDVAGVDDDASGDLDPRADSGTPDRVNDRKSGQAERTDPHPLRGIEHDSFGQRHLRQELVGDGGGEYGRIGAFAEAPRVVGMSVRNEDRVRPDFAQESLPVLAEVAEQSEAVRLDRERGVSRVGRRRLLDVTLRSVEVQAHDPYCHPEPFAPGCHPEPFALAVILSPSPLAVILSEAKDPLRFDRRLPLRTGSAKDSLRFDRRPPLRAGSAKDPLRFDRRLPLRTGSARDLCLPRLHCVGSGKGDQIPRRFAPRNDIRDRA